MKLAIIAIGIPGSGKTTLLKPFADRFGMRYVNRDEIREEWFGDPIVQIAKQSIWEEAERRTVEALAAPEPVLLDSTFTVPQKRIDAITMVRSAGAERVIGIVFTTPLEIAKERNATRDYHVREEVIESMHAQLIEKPPALGEGFDALYTEQSLSELLEKELGS